MQRIALNKKSEVLSLPSAYSHDLELSEGIQRAIDYADGHFERNIAQVKYFTDLQIECIKKNGQEIISRYAPNPQTLVDFRLREAHRGEIADKVVKALDIEPPEDAAVRGFIVEDLRGKYYEAFNDDETLIGKLISDLALELNIQHPVKKNQLVK